MSTEFVVLGQLAVVRHGRMVDIGPARRRHVLAVLLVAANQTVRVDQLVDRVWGESVPVRVASTLRSYVSRLRGILSDVDSCAIRRVPGGYLLEVDESTVDLLRFRRLVAAARRSDDLAAGELYREALGLWRGEPLADLDDPWVRSLRHALADELFGARLDYLDLRLRDGNHAELVPELEGLVRDHPLDERVAGQAMLALYRSGRQADALAHFERLRRRLATDLGVDPSQQLRGLHRRLLAADPALTGPAVALSTPRQLPASLPSLVGRGGELEAIDAAVRTGNLVAISGAAGTGKTSLALRWAHDRSGDFPDGQLYVDLRGFDPAGEPMPVETVIRLFLDALGVDPAVRPALPEARAALYRSLVADRRMLIVLDNARDSAQVAPLLPGTPSCEVVVTSRAQLTGLATSYGGHLLRVGALSRAAARDLLAGRLGPVRLAAEPGAVDHLLDHCAGLPLALSVVASRAAGRPELRLSELVDELRADAHPREEPDLTRLIARTGALAYLRREPPGYAVDLTAAGRTAPADGHRTADLIGQAHAHHAIARVSGKLNRLDDALYHLHQALDLFDVLGDRVGQARTHHGIGWIFQLRGDNDRFRVHAELSRALFAGTDDRVGLAGVLNSVGWAMAMTGDPRAALVHCEQALAAYQERGDRDGQVDSWDCLGFVHHTLGDYLEAVSCYLEALSVCRTIGDLHREADIVSNLAIIHATAGDHGAAERNASRSTAILDQLGVPGDDHVRAKLASAPVPVDPSSRWCTPR